MSESRKPSKRTGITEEFKRMRIFEKRNREDASAGESKEYVIPDSPSQGNNVRRPKIRVKTKAVKKLEYDDDLTFPDSPSALDPPEDIDLSAIKSLDDSINMTRPASETGTSPSSWDPRAKGRGRPGKIMKKLQNLSSNLGQPKVW